MLMFRAAKGSVGLARSFSTASPTDAKRAGGLVLFGGLVAGTASLGAWQVHRYSWKVDKISVRRAELALPPAPLAQVLAATASVAASAPNSTVKAAATVRGQARNYEAAAEGARRAVVVGTWDHSVSMLIGRRGAPDGLVGEKPQGATLLNAHRNACSAGYLKGRLGCETTHCFHCLDDFYLLYLNSSFQSGCRLLSPRFIFYCHRVGHLAFGLLPRDGAAPGQRPKAARQPRLDARRDRPRRRLGQA